jgi:hypothetical protein
MCVWSRRAVAVLAAAAVLGTGGCGKPARPNELPVYPVKGRFTFKGEPMGYATVTFYPAGKPFADALKSRATADANGLFELTTYELNDGAPAGEYEVILYWPVTPPDPNDLEAPNPPDKLKGAYTDPSKPKLKATVKPEPNTIDFAIP